MQTYRMLIDGEWVEADSKKTFDVMDPARDEVMAKVPTPAPPTWTGRSRRRGPPSRGGAR